MWNDKWVISVETTFKFRWQIGPAVIVTLFCFSIVICDCVLVWWKCNWVSPIFFLLGSFVLFVFDQVDNFLDFLVQIFRFWWRKSFWACLYWNLRFKFLNLNVWLSTLLFNFDIKFSASDSLASDEPIVMLVRKHLQLLVSNFHVLFWNLSGVIMRESVCGVGDQLILYRVKYNKWYLLIAKHCQFHGFFDQASFTLAVSNILECFVLDWCATRYRFFDHIRWDYNFEGFLINNLYFLINLIYLK